MGLRRYVLEYPKVRKNGAVKQDGFFCLTEKMPEFRSQKAEGQRLKKET
jgi:hypothetical protein